MGNGALRIGYVGGDPSVEGERPPHEIVGQVSRVRAARAETTRKVDSAEIGLPKSPDQGTHNL